MCAMQVVNHWLLHACNGNGDDVANLTFSTLFKEPSNGVEPKSLLLSAVEGGPHNTYMLIPIRQVVDSYNSSMNVNNVTAKT
jgi:hypothetical protein